MKKISSLLFIFFIGLGIVNAQTNKSYFVDLPSTNQDTTFENVLHFLLSSDYFVLSADKDLRLIQCKMVMPEGKVFQKLELDVLEYNLLIRSNQDKGTRIYIQANLKEKFHVLRNGVYMDDKGITKNPKYYEPLMELLKSNSN